MGASVGTDVDLVLIRLSTAAKKHSVDPLLS
jgi:hypothetical protein